MTNVGLFDRRSGNISRRELLVTSAFAAVAAAMPGPVHALSNTGALAQSTKGMVTSPHELATQAGLEVLRKGGNAIEAAIAIGATLCVTYPHFTGLGGDAFMIMSDRKGNVRTLSGVGQAAANPPNYSGSVPVRGPGSALTAAATVDTWDQAFDFSRKSWGGKLSWASLFERSIEYARKGFPVTPSQRFWQEFETKNLKDWPDVQRIFMPTGRMPEIGETLMQPELAGFLRRQARGTHRCRAEENWVAVDGGRSRPLPCPRRGAPACRLPRWRTDRASPANARHHHP